MTRDELIKEVAYQLAIEKAGGECPIPDPRFFEGMAKVAIETIFYALQEPTEDMRERGYDAIGDETLNPTTLGMNQLWQAMLNASPLAKEG